MNGIRRALTHGMLDPSKSILSHVAVLIPAPMSIGCAGLVDPILQTKDYAFLGASAHAAFLDSLSHACGLGWIG